MNESYFIDTHAHPEMIISFEKEKNNKIITHNNIVSLANKKNIKKIFCISTDLSDFTKLRKISKLYEEYYFSIGVHPCDIQNNISYKSIFQETLQDIRKNKEKIIGIGETGIDLYRNNDSQILKKQKEIFEIHIELAVAFNLPLIIHTRNATEITYSILERFKNKIIKGGVIHAFCESSDWAKKFTDLGFLLGIGGVISYPKNEHIRTAVKYIGLENIVLETDSPFLPMQKMRGKINYPDYISDINTEVSFITDQSIDTTKNIIFQNTSKLFFT